MINSVRSFFSIARLILIEAAPVLFKNMVFGPSFEAVASKLVERGPPSPHPPFVGDLVGFSYTEVNRLLKIENPPA